MCDGVVATCMACAYEPDAAPPGRWKSSHSLTANPLVRAVRCARRHSNSCQPRCTCGMSAAPMLWGRPRCSLRWRRRHRGSLGDGGDLATAAIAVAVAGIPIAASRGAHATCRPPPNVSEYSSRHRASRTASFTSPRRVWACPRTSALPVLRRRVACGPARAHPLCVGTG